MSGPDRVRFSVRQFPVLPALIAIALAVAASILLVVTGGGDPAYTVSLVPTLGDGTILPDQLDDCPTPEAASTSSDRSATVGRGAIVPISFSVAGDSGAAADTTITSVIEIDEGHSSRMAIALDAGIVCTTIESDDGAELTAATVGSPAAGQPVVVTTEVTGIDEGAIAIVHHWFETTASSDRADGEAAVQLVSADASAGAATLETVDLERPLSLVSRSETPVLDLELTDEDLPKEIGDELEYRVVVTNVSRGVIVNDVILTDTPDEFTSVVDVDISDDRAPFGECETADVVTCDLGFLAVGEMVEIVITTRVQEGAVTSWPAEDGDCESTQQDLCNRAQVTWRQTGGSTDGLDRSEPTNIDESSGVVLIKSASGAPGVVYADEQVVLGYSVRSNLPDASLSDVVLDDPGCGEPLYVDGDVNQNGLVDPEEIWLYTCVASSGVNAVDDALVVAVGPDGDVLEDAASIDVDVAAPLLSVFIASDDAWRVSNVGDVALENVHIIAGDCTEVAPNGLEPDDSWASTCPRGGEATAWAVDVHGRALFAEGTDQG